MKNIIIIFFTSIVFASFTQMAKATINDDAEQNSQPEISERAHTIYQEILEALVLGQITEQSKTEILNNFTPALIGEWSYFSIDNGVLEESKFIDDSVKIFDLTIINEQRIYNVSFTYFPAASQIYFTRKEYINSSAENVILALDEAKNDDELDLKFESSATHFFERRNYADYLTIKVGDVSGMISYVTSGIINIEKKRVSKDKLTATPIDPKL